MINIMKSKVTIALHLKSNSCGWFAGWASLDQSIKQLLPRLCGTLEAGQFPR
jgi:hypothetical protein